MLYRRVRRMDDSRLPRRLLWPERPDGWRCTATAPRKQWKVQVAADVSTHLISDTLATAANMTAERGVWRGLQYDISGIMRKYDEESKRTHPDALSNVA